jgi:hypothetical protein
MSHSSWVSRVLEDIGFFAAIALGIFAGIREALSVMADRPFPWTLLIVMAILAAPKTLGRMTAGRVWGAIAGMLPGRRSGGGDTGAAG